MSLVRNKYNISRFFFHILVAFITGIVIFVFIAIVFIFVGINGIGFIVLSALFGSELILFAVVSGFLSRWSQETTLTLRYIGWGPGRIVGLFTGGLLGYRVAGEIGGIVGAIALCILGRWAGSRLSILIGKNLERIFQLEPPKEKPSIPGFWKNRYLLFFVSVFPPALFFICAFMFSYYGIEVTSSVNILPYARFILYVFSVICIAVQWLMGNRLFIRFRTINNGFPLQSQFLSYLFGLVLSIILSISGFILVIFGASAWELLFFCMVSMVSGLLWTKYKFPNCNKTDGSNTWPSGTPS